MRLRRRPEGSPARGANHRGRDRVLRETRSTRRARPQPQPQPRPVRRPGQGQGQRRQGQRRQGQVLRPRVRRQEEGRSTRRRRRRRRVAASSVRRQTRAEGEHAEARGRRAQTGHLLRLLEGAMQPRSMQVFARRLFGRRRRRETPQSQSQSKPKPKPRSLNSLIRVASRDQEHVGRPCLALYIPPTSTRALRTLNLNLNPYPLPPTP